MQTELQKWNAARVEWMNHGDMFNFAAAVCAPTGLVLEFGVSSGNSTRELRNAFGNDKIYGFDSWQGLPEDDPHGWGSFKKGAYAAAKPIVLEQHFNVEFIDGWFKDTLPDFVKKHPEPAKFINIDCDLYSSTKDVFDFVIVQPGTVIYFDEYKEYAGWEGREFKAFMEFIERTGYDYDYILRTEAGGQAMVKLK